MRKSSGKSQRSVARGFGPADATAICAYLRRAHPLKTAEHVAARAGLGIAGVQKWLDGKGGPGGGAMLRLTAAYGPSFLAAALAHPPAWLDPAARSAEIGAVRRQLERLTRQIEGLR